MPAKKAPAPTRQPVKKPYNKAEKDRTKRTSTPKQKTPVKKKPSRIIVSDQELTRLMGLEATTSADAEVRRRAIQLQSAFDAGERKGVDEGRIELIDWLQTRYMSNEVARDDDQARALLTIAADAAAFLREQKNKPSRQRF